jgi:hypothetical protein
MVIDRRDKRIIVLVTAIGGPTGYGVLKSLENKKDIFIVGVDADKNCHAATKCNIFCVVPRVNTDAFIYELINIIEQYHIDIVIPTLQDELPLFNSIKQKVKVIMPQNINITDLLDKTKIYNLMMKISNLKK